MQEEITIDNYRHMIQRIRFLLKYYRDGLDKTAIGDLEKSLFFLVNKPLNDMVGCKIGLLITYEKMVGIVKTEDPIENRFEILDL